MLKVSDNIIQAAMATRERRVAMLEKITPCALSAMITLGGRISRLHLAVSRAYLIVFSN